MKKLCIFDFDGTLFDSIVDVAKCFNQTFKELSYETRDLDFYKKSLGGNIDEIMAIILQENNTPKNIEKVKSNYEKIYNKDKKINTRLYDGISALLEELQKEGYILAINSNRQTDSINIFLEKFLPNIDFIDVQGHVSTNASKPDPYGVNVIIDKSGVKKENSVYIGDSKTDIQTAKNAGIDCILVTWGYGVGDIYEDKYPLTTVDTSNELLKVIKNL